MVTVGKACDRRLVGQGADEGQDTSELCREGVLVGRWDEKQHHQVGHLHKHMCLLTLLSPPYIWCAEARVLLRGSGCTALVQRSAQTVSITSFSYP